MAGRAAALLTFLALASLGTAPAAEDRAMTTHAMTVEDHFRFKRVTDPQISPDGKQVVYALGTVDLEANAIPSALWLAPADGSAEPRPLTNAPGKKDRHPRWSPDGRWLVFESNRSGSTQLWILDMHRPGEARQLTRISTDASGPVWSPDGKFLAFASAVFPEFSTRPFAESDTLNKKRLEENEKGPVKARVFTRLFFRHWDSYTDGRRQHLFVVPFADGQAGEPKDATPGDRDAAPTSMTFETGDNFAFSPDSSHLVFTAVPARDEAWSTNYDLGRVPVTGGKTEWETLTRDNPAADSGPVFSPDGRRLLYRAQKKPGYEADKWTLMLVDVAPDGAFRGPPRPLTAAFDRSPDAFAWLDDATVVFTADDNAANPVFSLDVAKPDAPPVRWAIPGATTALSSSPRTRRLALLNATMTRPSEVMVAEPGSPPREISRANARLLATLSLPRPESVTVAGADGVPMQMWLLKPPGFDPGKKWPVIYLVHGGPQRAWEDGWSFRWCPSLWAAQGYVVALPNPRGSTGFGQKYVDEISGDWGGRCFADLMKGVDHLETLPFVDRDRIAAAGASFGGYMVNWFAVSTGRFKTLISHCGVWDFESMWGTTDELWFDEYEHGGLPWEVPGKYAEFSPHKKAGQLSKFKTPMLVIHNDLDFRCPIGQGQELFTALQRQRVPSRFVNFPDEGHWVLKPKNSQRWHDEVFSWLKSHVPPGGR